jgi:uncharacterized protein YkwD
MRALWQRATTGTGEVRLTRMGSIDFKSIGASARSDVRVVIVALAAALASALTPCACALASSARAQAPASLARRCRGAGLRPTSANLTAVDTATACLIDRARRAAHLHVLRANRSLQRVAARQSREMVLGDYFGDDSRSGQTPLQRIVATRYLRDTAQFSTAQNIGWGTDAQATPAAIVAAWMHSPPHREIILTEAFRDIGVGASPAAPAALAAGRVGATYTVEFGARQ